MGILCLMLMGDFPGHPRGGDRDKWMIGPFKGRRLKGGTCWTPKKGHGEDASGTGAGVRVGIE